MVRMVFKGRMSRAQAISNARIRVRNQGKTLTNIKSQQTKEGRVVTGRTHERK